MGKSQRNKGYRGEHNLVNYLKKHGVEAIRVPLSGASTFAKGDIVIQNKYRGEVKLRKDGFKMIYKWLADNDMLFIKADRKQYLAVIPLDLLIELLNKK